MRVTLAGKFPQQIFSHPFGYLPRILERGQSLNFFTYFWKFTEKSEKEQKLQPCDMNSHLKI
jgi:hypothetical protein